MQGTPRSLSSAGSSVRIPKSNHAWLLSQYVNIQGVTTPNRPYFLFASRLYFGQKNEKLNGIAFVQTPWNKVHYKLLCFFRSLKWFKGGHVRYIHYVNFDGFGSVYSYLVPNAVTTPTVNFSQTTRLNNAEDSRLQNRRRENMKSYVTLLISWMSGSSFVKTYVHSSHC